jgi:outer membrane receptor protein involved in Fe transport
LFAHSTIAPVRYGRSGLFLLLCAALSPPAQAQWPTDEIVVTAERQPQQSADVAASVATISGEELREVAPVHPAELLNRVAGVNINRGNGQEHLTALRSPVLTGGAGAGSFLYLEDGVPLRAAGFANVNGLFEANTEFASGLEVFRGPGSVLYGSNALHGLINVLTPDAREAYNRATVWAGPHENNALSATLRLPGEDGAWLFAGHAGHDGGYRASSGYDQQKAMLRYDGIAGDWDVSGKFSYQNLNQDTAGYVLGDDAYKDLSLVKGNDDPDAYRDAMSVRAQGGFRRALAGGELHLTPYARYTNMEFLMHFQPGQALEKNSHDSLGLLTTVYGGDDTFNYLAGFDVEYSRGELSEFQQQPTVFLFVQGAHYDYEVSALVASPYMSVEWPLGADTRLEAGVRYDYTRYEYDNRLPDGIVGRFLRIPDRDDTFHTATPKLTLTHTIRDGLNVYGRLARGSRAPQTTDLYRLQINQTEGSARAETLDILEAGLKYRGENLGFDTAVYAMQKENFFFRDAQGFNVTDGATDHYGIEADVQVVLSDWLIVAGDISVARHRYDFTREIVDPASATESIRDGDDVDTAPRKLWNLRLEGSWRALTAELEWRHVGEYYTDAANEHRYPGHDVWVLRGNYPLTSNVSLHARIDNLTDTRYAERADYAFGNTRYFPGEERAFYIGVTVNESVPR